MVPLANSLEQLVATAIKLNHAEFREFANPSMDKLTQLPSIAHRTVTLRSSEGQNVAVGVSRRVLCFGNCTFHEYLLCHCLSATSLLTKF
jgi:hypothetical protein